MSDDGEYSYYYEDVVCSECGNAVCSACGCCCTPSCERCSCPDVERDFDNELSGD